MQTSKEEQTKTKKLWFYFSFPALCLIFTLSIFRHLLASTDAYREGELIAEVRNTILSSYVEKVDSQDIMHGALRGMVSVLDPYSAYLDEDSYNKLYDSTEGEFIGIGIEITIDNGFITIVSPLDNSPAARAGVLAGDKIIEINNESSEGITMQEALVRLRGKIDTKVIIKVIHEGKKNSETLEIVRKKIPIASVKGTRIIDKKANIGYIRLTKFHKNTYDDFKEAIKQLRSKKVQSLIVDLRFNPGGVLDAAVDVVNSFIARGVIVYTKGRIRKSHAVHKAIPQKLLWKGPVVIITNKASASASEIVAGALQDYHRAIIVGNRTYGKGSVQSILPLRDEKSGLKLTTAKYYTPSGRSIHKSDKQEGGIIPDVMVTLSVEEQQKLLKHLNNPKLKNQLAVDKQLAKAVKVIKQKQTSRRFR